MRLVFLGILFVFVLSKASVATDLFCGDQLKKNDGVFDQIQDGSFRKNQEIIVDALIELQKSLDTVPHLTRKMYGTNVYHLAQSDSLKNFPEIASDSKAVIIFFPGAGTARGGGKNAMRTAASLSKYGVSLLSLDWPFHGGGPKDLIFNNAVEFKKLIFSIIKHYKKSGLPLYLTGHSFGSIIAQEVLYESPSIVDGAILMSSGGYQTPRILEHYKQLGATGAFDNLAEEQGVVWSEEAEKWQGGKDGSGGISGQLKSNKNVRMLETNKPVLVMAGNQDRWNTPDLMHELSNRFKKGELVILPNIGHHDIFSAPGKRDGIMIEKILEFIGKVQKTTFELEPGKENFSERIAYYYESSSLFRKWVVVEQKKPLRVITKSQETSKQVLKRWNQWFYPKIKKLAEDYVNQLGEEKFTEHASFKRVRGILSKHDKPLEADEAAILIQFLSYNVSKN